MSPLKNNSKIGETKLLFRDAYIGGKTRKKSKKVIITDTRWWLSLLRRMGVVIGEGDVWDSGMLVMLFLKQN